MIISFSDPGIFQNFFFLFFFFLAPLPRVRAGGGPGLSFPLEIGRFVPVPARIRGVIYSSFLF